MKIDNNLFPKSSFLSMEQDFSLIIDKIMGNARLKKLLYYDSADALAKSPLTQEQEWELLDNNIKIIPKIRIANPAKNYIVISFDNFINNPTNPEFRDNDIIFDIVCHIDTWRLKDFQLRPYKIAGELDYMLNQKRLTGIGLLQFVSCNMITVNADYIELCLIYHAIHGEEDKQNMLNPMDWAQYVEDFDK